MSEKSSDQKVPWQPAVVAGLIVLAGVIWYFWVLGDWKHAATWGAIGDAVGPFAGLATALALALAVYTTMLQRQELKLQREEMRAQREEMARQREEAARAADAQAALVTSQQDLARAQYAAVRAATATLLAQHTATIAALEGSKTAIALQRVGYTRIAMQEDFDSWTRESVNALDELLGEEKQAARQLRAKIARGEF